MNYKLGAYGHLHTRVKEVQQTKEVDILFLGSSHAYRGFDTRIFKKSGFKTFNLGSSAQSPLQTKVLLDRYLDELNPKLVIYEVFPRSFESDGVESSLDLIANDTNDWGTVKMVFQQSHIKVYNTLIYGLYRDLFNKNKNYKERSKKGADHYIKGGFVHKKTKNFRKKHYKKSTYWNIKDRQVRAFEDAIDLFKAKNINYALVQAPTTSRFYKSHTNNEVFDSLMIKHGTYYNFNKLLKLREKKHFYDYHHLNQRGVKVFNNKLIKVIEIKEYLKNKL